MIERIRAAHAKAAELVLDDPVYAPIFERLEAEIADAEARAANDPVARARAVIAQRSAANIGG